MLDQLKRKLSSLERENAISAARVRELENRLEKDERDASVRGAFPPPAAHQDAREDWEEKLRQEQEQRLGSFCAFSSSFVPDRPPRVQALNPSSNDSGPK